MSIEVMSKVLRHSLLPEGERFALVVLADFGNDDGIGIYASRRTIAKRMGSSVATVKRRLSNLKDCGVLSWEVKGHDHGNGTETNEYKIKVEMIGKEDVSKVKRKATPDKETVERIRGGGVTHEPTGGVTHEPVVGSRMSHNPLDKPSVKPLVSFADAKVASAGKPETPTNAQVEIQTLENSESEKGAHVPPPAPARAADVRRADDMIQVYAERKAGGKLQHWDITRKSIDDAVANRHNGRDYSQSDKAAITRACDSIGEIVMTAANANGWHTYRSKRDLMQIVALDLPIDLIRTFIDADCAAIKAKQQNRENYGTGDALQSVRIGMANAKKLFDSPNTNRPYRYEEIDGELKIVWLD